MMTHEELVGTTKLLAAALERLAHRVVLRLLNDDETARALEAARDALKRFDPPPPRK